MSEYQYYEFLAIDRPLDKEAREDLRNVSSRARISATQFTNTYEWGDFKGDPDALMEAYFDLHLYLANWGTRRLMVRVPEGLIDKNLVHTCLRDVEDCRSWTANGHLILDINGRDDEADELDGEGWLSAIAPARADLLAGDHRLLYVVWLMGIQGEQVDEDDPEPLPGIGPITGALEAFASFFNIDPDLMDAAAERDAVAPIDAHAAHQAIADLSESEKAAILTMLFDGDPLARGALRQAVHARLGADRPSARDAPRTAGELRTRAAAIRQDREAFEVRRVAEERARLEREAAAARRKHLDAIADRGEAAWGQVEAEIERSNVGSYNRAVELLIDLREIAERADALAGYTRRLTAIRERHARKARFLERIAGLT